MPSNQGIFQIPIVYFLEKSKTFFLPVQNFLIYLINIFFYEFCKRREKNYEIVMIFKGIKDQIKVHDFIKN